MKEEIKNKAAKYVKELGALPNAEKHFYEMGFIAGAEWMFQQSNRESKEKAGWISVEKNGVPKDENFYLLAFKETSNITVGNYWHSEKKKADRTWYDENGEQLFNVTHYMKLPEPPKNSMTLYTNQINV